MGREKNLRLSRRLFSLIIVGLVLQRHGQPIVVHRDGLELEAAGAVLGVDLLLDGGIHHATADILIHRMVGETQIVLVGEAGPADGPAQ